MTRDVPLRQFEFVSDADALPPSRDGTTVIVLDTSWTPLPGGRTDVIPLRTVFRDITARYDLFDDALERLDTWGDAYRLADRLVVEGVTYWYRMRETMWRWLHERLLWRHVLAEIGALAGASAFVMPEGEVALRDIASRLGPVAVEPTVAAAPGPTPASPAVRIPTPRALQVSRSPFTRIARRLTRFVGAQPTPPVNAPAADPLGTTLDDRADRMIADSAERVVVLTTPWTYQRVGGPSGPLRDPIHGSAIDALDASGVAVTLVAIGLDERSADDRALVESDERMLPLWMFRRRWSRPEDRARVERATVSLDVALADLRSASLEVDGLDLTAAFTEALAQEVRRIARIDLGQRARVERFLAELRPDAILLAQEWIRLPWLSAAREVDIPLFAVQHGILYAGHPGYPHRRHDAVVRPTLTFVYGDDEREVLVARGAYVGREVAVVGSPRRDLDRLGSEADDRAAVRRELGVASEKHMLVVSTTNLPFVQSSHFASMIDRVLGGPLPGVHVIFKLHPGERTDGPYRALLTSLAAAGGWEPPPIDVVRDIDLYRLLATADAHLGLHSTVLTDAVIAGVRNLIAMTDAHADLLGYVDADVAIPVRSPADVMAAMTKNTPVSLSAREAFLRRHDRPGAAGARIAAAITGTIQGRKPRSAAVR